MPDRGHGTDIPPAVRDAVGSALNPHDLANWWEAKSEAFGGHSPRAVWEDGKEQEVLDFIAGAKSGDMA